MNPLHLKKTQKHKNKPLLSWINLPELTLAAIGAAIIALAVEGAFTPALLTIAIGISLGFTIAAKQTSWMEDTKFNRFLQREGIVPVIALLTISALCLYFLMTPEPAMAQFFNHAQTKLTEGDEALSGFLAGTDASAENLNKFINLIFVAYRFVIIIYLGTSLVKVIGAMREDEDWKSAAKIPALVLVVLSIADIASVLILGA